MVGRLRRGVPVLLAAMRRAADARGRHRRSPPDMPLPEKLKLVQSLMAGGRLPGAENLRDDRHLPRLRHRAFRRLLRPAACARPRPRDLRARAATSSSTAPVPCSRQEFPELAERIRIHVPDENDKRHGQAIAAASLPELGRMRTMNPYQHFVAEIARLVREGKQYPLGGFPTPPRPPLADDAPTALIFSPHPDDECIIGGLALRLLREAGVRVVNVAVTQGSNKRRQAARWGELTAACKLSRLRPDRDAARWAREDQRQDASSRIRRTGTASRRRHRGDPRAEQPRASCSSRTTPTGTARTSARTTWSSMRSRASRRFQVHGDRD